MSEWNYDYLEAIGVPVWVPQVSDDAVVDDTVAVEQEAAPTANPELLNVMVSGVPLLSTAQATHHILFEDSTSKEQSMELIKQLQRAWKAWQNTPFPLAVWQASQSEQATEINTNNGQWFGLKNSTALPEVSIQTPQQRKAWWAFLQGLTNA